MQTILQHENIVYRPLNSHGFAVRLKFLGLFSRSHGQELISQGHAPDLKDSQGFRL